MTESSRSSWDDHTGHQRGSWGTGVEGHKGKWLPPPWLVIRAKSPCCASKNHGLNIKYHHFSYRLMKWWFICHLYKHECRCFGILITLPIRLRHTHRWKRGLVSECSFGRHVVPLEQSELRTLHGVLTDWYTHLSIIISEITVSFKWTL